MVNKKKIYLFVRNIPQPDFSIERARYKKLVIFWMEDNSSYEVDVLKYTETFLSTDVPQSHSLVHAAGQDEEVLGPGHVQ